MTNHFRITKGRAARPMDSVGNQLMWMGFDDVRQGLGFRREYETMSLIDQRNYERGRQIAANCAGEFGSVPKWKRNQTLKNCINGAFGFGATFRAALPKGLWSKDKFAPPLQQ